ncbi:MAG: phosphotransferase [Clostridia bacterium]|nr:phosphotransferase [Clostridia bacterium]
MKILDNGNKHILPIIPELVSEKIDKKVSDIKFIGGGSYGRVYKTILSNGETIAVKAYRIPGSQYEEAQQLNILSANTSVEMPKVLFTYEDDETAILAMTFVAGQNALNPMFLLKSKSQKQKFADDVVSGMLQWHSVTNDKFGALSDPVYDTWLEYYKKEKQEPWLTALKELSENGKFGKKKLKLLYDATEIFNSLPEEKTKPVLIHGDLNIMNIMADPKTLELTAFIDPCGSLWADREYDLFQLRNMWGDAYCLYETYKQKCKLSEYADFRVAYYASMHEAAMRLKGGLIMPLWEDLNNARLKKEMKKLKEKTL